MFELIVGIMQTVSKQYQFRLDHAEKPVFTRFSAPLQSLPFDGSDGFFAYIPGDAVDSVDGGYNAVADGAKRFEWDLGHRGSDGVDGVDGAYYHHPAHIAFSVFNTR